LEKISKIKSNRRRAAAGTFLLHSWF